MKIIFMIFIVLLFLYLAGVRNIVETLLKIILGTIGFLIALWLVGHLIVFLMGFVLVEFTSMLI